MKEQTDAIDGEFTPLPPVTHFVELAPSWEIREGESSLWYERFTYYLKQGPSRAIFAAYREYCKEEGREFKDYPPAKWYKESKESDWEMRSKTYDQYLRALGNRVDEEARAEARAMRRELLSRVKVKLNKTIEDWEPQVDLLDWETISSTLKVLLELSRGEFGDTEPEKSLAVNVHANGKRAFEDSVKQVYDE